jgi:hypothetical protein
VLVEVVDQDDGVHGMVQKLLDVLVAGDAQHLGRLLAALVLSLAHRDHLHPSLPREASQGSTSAESKHPDANGLGHLPIPCHRPATAPA